MRRYAMRRDKGEAAFKRALRAAGCSVYSVGPPLEFDLLVGSGGVTYLVELKSRARVEAKNLNLAERVRRERQAEWRKAWRGGSTREAWDDDAAGFLASIGPVFDGLIPFPADARTLDDIGLRTRQMTTAELRALYPDMHAPAIQQARRSRRAKP